MPRDLPVSNGNLLVNFDLEYRVRDIYFPYIGQENHTLGHEFRFGVWADGEFSWMGEGWERDLRYRDDSLVSEVHLRSERLGLALHCRDAVDSQLNVYVRLVDVTDLTGKARDVRLFFGQDFYLSGHAVGDTAYYDPRTNSVVHYKGARYFLANCRNESKESPTTFACGAKGSPATRLDPEAGELNRNPIAWGLAESTIGVSLELLPLGTQTASYWLAAGTHYDDVASLNTRVVAQSPKVMVERTANYWKAWVRKERRTFGDLPKSVTDIFNRSLLILRSQIDNRGAIIAANDSDIVRFGGDTYSYMWGRDGAFVAAALARAGYSELCRQFFAFCNQALTKEGYLFQHYNPDGSLASNWHGWLLDGEEVLPIQEDSTALLLWSLWIDYESSRDIEFIRPLYESLITKSADFLLLHREVDSGLPIPSYDLWEERYALHAYTASTVISGLRAAARFARVFQDTARVELYTAAADRMAAEVTRVLFDEKRQRFARSGSMIDGKFEHDGVIDVSLLGLATFDVVPYDDPRMVATMHAIREQLTCHTVVGGIARYSNDMYQRESDVPAEIPGNPWFISALWLADYEIGQAKTIDELHDALPHLEWCARNALPSGVLAEQVHPVSGQPLSVSPLTWSHSAFVWTVLGYVERLDELTIESLS